MAASSLSAPLEQVAGFKEMLDTRGSPEIEALGSTPPITAVPANGLVYPAAAKPFSSDELASSMVSPTLVRFAVEEELKLPWAVSGAPGLASHGPQRPHRVHLCASLRGDGFAGLTPYSSTFPSHP